MPCNFFTYIQPISLYIAITFIIAFFFLNLRKEKNKLLLTIVGVALYTEIATLLLVIYSHKIDLAYSISIFMHGSLWLWLIFRQFRNSKAVGVLFAAFLLFGIVNLFFLEGLYKCNFNTFIVGALLYIVLFIYKSFQELKNENFTFFQSNNYLLLFSPVLFFFGLSFVFGFKSQKLAETIVFNNIMLYDFIIYFVNIIYYTLINIYIYREKKLKHA